MEFWTESFFEMCLKSLHKYKVFTKLIMIPVVLSVIMRAAVSGQNCFGGVETFEKTTVTDYDRNVQISGTLLHQENVALTRDCINLCKQQSQCHSFALDYAKFRCVAYAVSSKKNRDRLIHAVSTNFFDKMCLNGISRPAFDTVCGHERLWAFERVKSAFLDGFVERAENNVGSKEECAKACLMESSFICRSADYDESQRICRMSKEDRRTQPQAFRQIHGNVRDYLENQCAAPGPSSCVYRTKPDFSVLSLDSLHFSESPVDCQTQCDKEASFNCRAFSYLTNRCVLSGDDGVSLVGTSLPVQKGATYGERTCVAELCTNGIFTYEKMTGYVLRSAVPTPIDIPTAGSLGSTGLCRSSCDSANLNCPSFSVNYQSGRCEKLDRNSQGRTGDLIVREGESYFEKICLRVPQIMSMCQDKYWVFERVLGHELAPRLYPKTLNFVQSRRDCEEYCLQEREFPCRSALYNDETTECKLSKEDRRTQPSMYYRSRSLKINYLENQCIRSHSTCPFERTLDAYPTYTDIVETNGVVNQEVCQKYCNDNKRFLCRSYAYYSSNGQCFISGDDHASAGSGTVQKRSGIVYFERQCPDFPVTETVTQNTSGHTLTPTQTPKPSPEPTPSPTPSRPPPSSTNTSITVTKLPTQPPSPSGTGLAPPFDPFAPPRHAVTGTAMRGPEIPRALETDLHNVHSGGVNTQSKCGPHNRFVFEKVTSFEPIGGHLALLYSDLQTPGIVTECARRCEHSNDCRAFVVDYYHQSCHALLENSSVGSLDLRLSVGKDYFEGFCVPKHIECGKFWPFDRILDQASIGVSPHDKIRFISRGECRKRCLEERKFRCLSASYDSSLHECRLYTDDRNSGGVTLLFTKGTDYMENQCQIDTSACKYYPIERDISIVPVTKSVRGTSTFHCEQSCDNEKEFNCRSYTYLDTPGGPNPGGNLCLLSSENRATTHQGSMQFRPRALYAEKDCTSSNHRTSRVSSTPFMQSTPSSFPHPTMQAPTPGHSAPHNQLPHIPPICGTHQYTFEKTFGSDLRYARRERAPMPPRMGIIIHCQDECLRRGDRCRAFVVEYGPLQSCFFLDESAGENRNQLSKTLNTAYSEKICLREKTCGKLWTFERVIGFTFKETADKEIPTVVLRTDCEDLCLAEKTFACRAATFDYTQRVCKLFTETRRSRPSSFQKTNEAIDYFENQCSSEPSTCQYRDTPESFFQYIDRLTHAFSLAECQRQCDGERLFPCRSINYEMFTRECALSSEDTIMLGIGSSALMPRRNSLYSEKGNCEQVSVQCNQQDMVLTLNFDSPFNGRVYAKGKPSECFVRGTGQTHLQFAISLGSRCGTRQEGAHNYMNEVVVQQHAVIMTDNDRTIRVLCSFETGDQTVTLSNPIQGKPGGIDVTALMNARTRLEHPIASIVTNTAPPPAIMMRILDRSGHDAQVVGLGDELTLRIELKDPASAFAIFARNLYARSSNGESLFLIDNTGCPADAAIFPALQVDIRDRRSLYSTFKAFRFPSTGVVNFEVQIRFCQDRCEPVKCANGFESYGKRKKRNINYKKFQDYLNETESLRKDENIHPILVPYDERISVITKRKKIQNTTQDISETIDETTIEISTQIPDTKSDRSAVMEEKQNKPMTEEIPQNQYLRSDIQNTNESKEPKSPVFNVVQQPQMNHNSIPIELQSHDNQNPPEFTTYGRNPPQYPPHYTRYSNYNPPPPEPILPPPHLPQQNNNQQNYNQQNDHQQNYNQQNDHQQNYNQQNYNQHHYDRPQHHYNQHYYSPQLWNQRPNGGYDSGTNRSFWPFPYEITSLHGNLVQPTPVPYIPTHYSFPRNDPQPHPAFVRTTRPPVQVYNEWGKSNPSPLPSRRSSPRSSPRSSSRPKIISASTQRPQPQEIPLSLAIMVGDDKDNNWKQNNVITKNSQTKKILIEECSDCSTGLTVFITTLTVSLIHIGVFIGAYLYIYKYRSIGSKLSTVAFDNDDEIAGIHHLNITNNGNNPQSQSRNANVFYGNREIGFRSSNMSGITFTTQPCSS